MSFPRSPFDRTVADTLHWARFIDKVRQHLDGVLPEEFARALGHTHGVDGQFLAHFELTIKQVTNAVAGKSDVELSNWLETSVDGFPGKRETWNKLAPNLGKAGFPMDRALKIAMRRLYKEFDWSSEITVFKLIEMDEGRA